MLIDFKLRKFFFLICISFISACGFTLKGQSKVSHPLPLKEWYVNGNGLQKSLEYALKYADGTPVNVKSARAKINILSLDTSKDAYTINRAAVVNEYLLTLHVRAQATLDGKNWGNVMDIVVERKLDYSDSAVLGKFEEEGEIWREMKNDAAEQIVTRLTYLK